MIKTVFQSLTQLFFPHNCCGCGTDVIDKEHELCLRCLHQLPITNYNMHANNITEKNFWGRLPLTCAASFCYFDKGGLVQQLMHQLKYKNNKEIGWYLGKMMGHWLQEANRFNDVDALVPLPLFPSKEKKRGYNQSTILCEGMSEAMQIPVLKNAVIRLTATETQTNKHRIERWQNMEGRFFVADEKSLEGKHILLVDDIVTTGATLESCGQEILAIKNTRLSIVTMAYTVK